MKVPCSFCETPLDSGSKQTYQQVTGWTRKRTGGGTNQVALAEPVAAFACGPCISLRTARNTNLIQGQETLL